MRWSGGYFSGSIQPVEPIRHRHLAPLNSSHEFSVAAARTLRAELENVRREKLNAEAELATIRASITQAKREEAAALHEKELVVDDYGQWKARRQKVKDEILTLETKRLEREQSLATIRAEAEKIGLRVE